MISKMKYSEIRSRIDKKTLLKAYAHLLGAAACAVVFWVYRFQGADRTSANSWKTVVGFVAFFGMAAFLIGFFRLHKRAVPAAFFEWVGEKVFKGLALGIGFIFKPLTLLFDKLGLFRGGQFLRGKDERSFFFMRPGSKQRKRVERMPKWKNLTDNGQRVRFLFMKYMNFRIKKGYVYKKTMTPEEMRLELEPQIDPEDENAVKAFTLLFGNYPTARYDSESRIAAKITDELVTEMRDLI